MFNESAFLFGVSMVAVLSAALAFGGLRRMLGGRVLAGGSRALGGLVMLGGAATIGLVGSHLYTYRQLTDESLVAEISLARTGPQQYSATLELSGEPARVLALRGDEWQLDARILKWKPQATLLGFDTLYRPDRLTGRYRSVADERSAPRTVFELSGPDPVDLWQLARDHQDWVRWIDAGYGSGTYVPMADGARFSVWISATGLLARPENDAARAALADW